ncbi:ABC transporter ATP-binding protein [Waddlia chondrophila]|nr:ATP-binding cassette domain-containing protein [Waddlia chondrophila]
MTCTIFALRATVSLKTARNPTSFAMISIKNIRKTYDNGKTYIVDNISLEIPEGKTVILLGSSGCGKTTLLKMINRLIESSSGEIIIDNQNIRDYDPIILKRTIGYAFQGVGLFPHLTVKENVTIVLKLMGMATKQIEQKALDLLKTVNLEPKIFSSRFPDELSGGQQQRVGVARSLATHPKYLLMDEPFGALDAINRDAMQEEMRVIRDKFHTTVLFVTHDIFEAIKLGDLIAVMNKGKIEQTGTPAELINHPQTSFVKNLFQKPLEQLKLYKEELKT